jgi:branched-chain amino acid:cation transporter, LIVCS family
MKTSRIVATGFAMFAMLFGAGNVVYPLALGRDIGHQLWFGLLGFVLTAVVIPLIGLVSTMLAQGDYKQFLGKLGVVPGNLVILICMILIGPFAIIPRCITIAHGAVHPYVDWLSLAIFSVISAVIIFVSTIRRTGVVDLLGKYLGPLKFILLFSIIIVGLLNPAPFVQVGLSAGDAFGKGMSSGLGTCDLLATIFFSGLIFAGLRRGMEPGEELSNRELAKLGLKAGLIGGVLLGLVYTGFCVVAANMGSQLVGVADNEIFSVIARLVLGVQGGLLANLTVALACLTTAIALTVVFASYLHRDVFHGKTSYLNALLLTIGITAVMSNLGFAGIMKILFPIITLIYPALIVLAIMHMAQKLWGFNFIKVPVALTFVASLALKYFC